MSHSVHTAQNEFRNLLADLSSNAVLLLRLKNEISATFNVANFRLFATFCVADSVLIICSISLLVMFPLNS